jgi:hypothetical protein
MTLVSTVPDMHSTRKAASLDRQSETGRLLRCVATPFALRSPMTSDIAASVVLVTGDGAEHLAGILARLRHQTIAHKLEVIFVTRDQHVDGIAALKPNEFGCFKVFAGDLSTSARGRAMGVHAATAPITIFAEDHSFPVHDDWAERIVRHFDDDWAGVGPVVRNANPSTGASCATLLLEYGPFLGRHAQGPTRYIAGHNCAYRTELLTAYGNRLGEMLESEWRLQNELRVQGHRFLVDPEIQVAHMNYSRVGPSLKLHHLAGRMFAASRRTDWNTPRRLAFALAAPLIFAKRFVQTVSEGLRPETRRDLPRSIPPLVVYLAVSAAGEAMGYLFGTGGRERELAELEYSRWRHVRPEEVDLQLSPTE